MPNCFNVGFVRPSPDKKGINIKSIQRGSISFTTTATTQNVTINTVKSNNCILYVRMTNIASTSDSCLIAGEIISDNTLAFYRDGEASTQGDAEWELIEFTNVKSIQRGSLSGAGTITISAINVNKAMTFNAVSIRGRTGYGSTFVGGVPYTTLVNSTTIKITWADMSLGSSFTNYWQVIEFY